MPKVQRIRVRLRGMGGPRTVAPLTLTLTSWEYTGRAGGC